MDDRPIGIFDSGFGGLTVARALIDLLPNEDLVYFGDTGRYPYGPKSLDQVRGFASQITSWLVERHDVKMVVVACNTAAAAALEHLRFETEVPVVGVIDPGVRAMVGATRTGRVGVIGTLGTVRSGAYQRAVQAARAHVNLTCAACPGFVEFVERGETNSEQVHVLAERLLAPVISARVDTLLLGCTHYPSWTEPSATSWVATWSLCRRPTRPLSRCCRFCRIQASDGVPQARAATGGCRRVMWQGSGRWGPACSGLSSTAWSDRSGHDRKSASSYLSGPG